MQDLTWDYRKDDDLRCNYGITAEDYNIMRKNQKYSCAICKTPEDQIKTRKVLFIDHNHETKKVRGLLCNNCNCFLGKFKDNISFILSAINYLEFWSDSSAKWEWIEQTKMRKMGSGWKPGDFKKCRCCGEWKEVSNWYGTTIRKDRGTRQIRPVCIGCYSKVERLKKKGMKPKSVQFTESERKEFDRDFITLKYGILSSDFNKMLAIQNFKCGICSSDEAKGSGTFHIDHCHYTNKVRGLLCHPCNLGLGFMNNIEDMKNAVAYLKENNYAVSTF